jgi:PAS domain S-box-containing protein
MLGYERTELIGKHVSLWEAKTSRQELEQEFLPRIFAQANRVTLETLHRRKDGTLISVEVHVSVVVTRRERFIYASSRNITERNRLRAEIDSALKRFEAIFQDNPVALGMLDFNNGLYLDVNPAWELLTGYRRGEVIGRRSEEIGMWADPLDRQALFATLRPDGVVGPWEGQFRAADGRMGTCSVKGRVVSLASQRLFIWAIEDVTERRRVEVGLRLAASVFDFSHDGIMVSDADNKIIEINPAFSRITGYQRDEVLGHDPIKLSAETQDPEFQAAIWESLARTSGWRGCPGARRTRRTARRPGLGLGLALGLGLGLRLRLRLGLGLGLSQSQQPQH